jgi:hypothetical protein
MNADLKKQIKNAISDIVLYETLPPQIDYTKPYKIKHDKGIYFINKLHPKLKNVIEKQIEKQIDAYYTPSDNGLSAAYCDSLF